MLARMQAQILRILARSRQRWLRSWQTRRCHQPAASMIQKLRKSIAVCLRGWTCQDHPQRDLLFKALECTQCGYMRIIWQNGSDGRRFTLRVLWRPWCRDFSSCLTGWIRINLSECHGCTIKPIFIHRVFFPLCLCPCLRLAACT